MSDLAQRMEAALAAASATLLSAHAQLSRAAAVRLASRLPPARTIALYCHAQDLSPVDATWIRMQALARLGAFCLTPLGTAPAGASRMERIRCALREWVRVHFAPHGDPALQEQLEFENAYARAVILKLHVRSAIRFAAAVRPDISGPAAVLLYLDRMRVPRDIGGAVYAMATAQLAAVRFAAMLPPAGGGARVGRSLAAGADDAVPQFSDNRLPVRGERNPGGGDHARRLGRRVDRYGLRRVREEEPGDGIQTGNVSRSSP